MAKNINPLKAAITGMQPKEAAPRLVEKAEAHTKRTATTDQAPSRIGKKAVTGHFEPTAARQLKMLGVESDPQAAPQL